MLRAKLVVLGGPRLSCERALAGIARMAGLSFAGRPSMPTGSRKPSLASSQTGKASGAGKVAAPDHGGVLGARVGKVLPGSRGTQVALLAVLALAIALLFFGTVPPEIVPHSGTAAFLARRRALIAGAGVAALTVFLLAYFGG